MIVIDAMRYFMGEEEKLWIFFSNSRAHCSVGTGKKVQWDMDEYNNPSYITYNKLVDFKRGLTNVLKLRDALSAG